MSIISEIQKELKECDAKITAERQKGPDKRDKRKVVKLQKEHAALTAELAKAMAGITTRKLQGKKDPPKKEEDEDEDLDTEEDEDDDD